MVRPITALLVACGSSLALRRNIVDLSAKKCEVLLTSAEQLEYAKMGQQEQMSFLGKAGCAVNEGSCDPSALMCLLAGEPKRSMCCHYNSEVKRGYSVTNLFDQKFEIFDDGWTPLLQVPRKLEKVSEPKLLVSGYIQPFSDTLGCEASRISDLHFSGSWLSENVTVRSGGIEAPEAFAVCVGERAWQPLSYATVLPNQMVSFLNSSVKVEGKIATLDQDSWGPDATLHVEVGNITVDVLQRTLGRFNESRAFLDISVRGRYHEKNDIGGWLGLDGEVFSNASKPKSCISIVPSAK